VFAKVNLKGVIMCAMRTPALASADVASVIASESDSGSASASARRAEDERCWQAVVQRDKSADGSFVYAVRSTGVACLPSCPARRARRDNVSFYADLAAAQRDGYRPCKRCKPEQPVLSTRQAQTVAAACRLIEQESTLPSLAQLAQTAGLSRFHFHRLFKLHTGVTPKDYAAAWRAQRVREQLATGGSVTSAMYDAGFNSSGRFYAAAPAMLGMTPSAYRAGGSGEAIRFAVAQCWLGAILVAATAQGVCAVTLGDDPEQLVHDLQDRFAQAEMIGADAQFEQWVARVISIVEAPGSAVALQLELPLDVRGTAFQQRVWQALREIPAGQRLSYAELARRIGQPRAVRAVASACGANAIAVLIPCHRVVRTDGGLSGYRWGVARKQALLEYEQGE
jgi:AraC family transcriptional regulator of adaptative response/methylated-DNA-[protein]-cysteine methyltransferase